MFNTARRIQGCCAYARRVNADARVVRVAVCLLCCIYWALPAVAQQTDGPAVIWQDRGRTAALDLIGGPGVAREPGTLFLFIKESDGATSPKFDVEDEHGTTWKVKLGEEARPETAATRLLWAMGYVVDEAYYRSSIHVLSLPRLVRGQEFVADGGIVSGARLERDPDTTDARTWSWSDNPFVGTREFNGLRVMMALLNNWDLKDDNNSTTAAANGEERFGITDLGATWGRTGNVFGRSKGVSKDYAGARFIDKVTPTHVDFVLNSRPFLLSIVRFRSYRERTRMESVVRHIPIAHARWIGDRLGELSPEQVRDCFRAAGYSPADVDAYAGVVLARIAALKALPPPPPVVAPALVPDVAASNARGTEANRCLESTCRQAPLRETLAVIGIGARHARGVLGGFEQGAGLGGGVELTSADAVPVVEFRALALTSSQLYRRFDLQAVLQNIGGSRNHADVWFSYARREVDFFDVGSGSASDVETPFTLARTSYQGSVSRDLASHLQGGVYVQVMDTDSTRSQDAPDTPPGVIPPSLLMSTRIRSYGGFLAYDTRDNSVGLTRGVNLYARMASADGLGSPPGTTASGWLEGEFDARGYIPLGSPRTALLLRSRGFFKGPKDGGRLIPFYDLPWLGGRQYLRGYDNYRFRGNHVLVISTELQRTVRALTDVRGIDLLASADAGQVWGNGTAFRAGAWRAGLGGGLQYRHSRALAARVEVSRSEEGAQTYFALSRGF